MRLVMFMLICLVAGCAGVEGSYKITQMVEGKPVIIEIDFEYSRWLNQTIGGLLLESPYGWNLYLDKIQAKNQLYMMMPYGEGGVK